MPRKPKCPQEKFRELTADVFEFIYNVKNNDRYAEVPGFQRFMNKFVKYFDACDGILKAMEAEKHGLVEAVIEIRDNLWGALDFDDAGAQHARRYLRKAEKLCGRIINGETNTRHRR